MVSPNPRCVLLFDKTTCATNATSAGSGAYVDRRDYDYLTILFSEYTTSDTTAALVLQLEEGDTTSSFATFAGGRGGTDFTTIAVPSATASSVQYQLNLSLLGRKRYLRLKWTPGATNVTAYGIAMLTRAGQVKNTTTELNVGCIYNG